MSNAAVRFIDRHVEASLGGKRAFEFNGKPYSYHDLAALANRAGNMLKALGVGPGARVAMLLPESPAWFGTLIGAMKIGAVPVVVADANGFAEAARTARVCVIHARFLPVNEVAKDKTVVVGEAPQGHPSFVDLMRAQASSLAAQDVAPEAPALVVEGRSFTHRDVEGDASKLGRVGELLHALEGAQTAQLT
ncbi:MAG TPA: AMP-binding protein [Burkholderiales bacterium]|nr:AMP-binding protein [Burkholderiales bacterium]